MNVNQGIFKAYDVRGVYPGEIDEEVAGEIGRAFVTYLGATTDRRVARHAPLVADDCGRVHRGGARAGVRRRRLRDDGDRHAVLRGRQPRGSKAARRSPRRTTPASTTASRWCAARRSLSAARRASARSATCSSAARFPRRRPRPGAARRRTSSPPTSTTSCRSSTRRSSSRSRWWPTRATAWAVSWRRRCLHGCPAA